jgi:GT2 family glycosyltransferase
MKNISIIIVNYNAKDYLYNCIQSILNNNSKLSIEILIVDNLSTDGSVNYIKDSFPFINIIENNNNLGFAKGNNIGIAKSSGKYIMLINPDVVLMEGCLENIYEFMENNTNIGLLGPKIIDSCGKTQRSCMGFPTIWNSFCRSLYLDRMFPKIKLFGGLLLGYWGHDYNKSVDVINGCFWAVRRKAMENVGLLDESFFMYGEDIDWCRRFHYHGWDVYFYKDAEAIHFGGVSSSSAPNRFYIELQKANIKYYNKYNKNKLLQSLYWLIVVNYQVTRIMYHFIRYIFYNKNRDESKNHLIMYWKCMEWLLI